MTSPFIDAAAGEADRRLQPLRPAQAPPHHVEVGPGLPREAPAPVFPSYRQWLESVPASVEWDVEALLPQGGLESSC